MRVTSSAILPMLVTGREERGSRDCLRDEFLDGLTVAYSFGPSFGERFLTASGLDRLGVTRRELHRLAAANLREATARARILGQPPTLMLSFEGVESSVLLDAGFWAKLSSSVPGEVVVGVPARDVVIVTGSASPPGMAKIRRAVDRVFFAGGPHLLSRDLLVWRRGAWELLRPVRPAGRRPSRAPSPPPIPEPEPPSVPAPALRPAPSPPPPPVPAPALHPVPAPTPERGSDSGFDWGLRPKPVRDRAVRRGTRPSSDPVR